MKHEEKHHLWKGDFISYSVLHRWVQKHLGVASICSNCLTTSKITRIEWANISGNYLRQLDDWLPMCRSCHMIFDDVSKRVWETRKKRYGKSGHKKDANWKGWRHSSESRIKMSKIRKGKKFSTEHKRNLSIAIRNYWEKKKNG